MRVPASSTNGGVACLLTTFTKRYRRKPIRLPHHGTSVGNAKRRGARHCSLRQKRYVPPRSALAPFSREARRFPSASSSSPFFPSFQPLGDDHWRAKRGFKDPASAARAAGTVFFFFFPGTFKAHSLRLRCRFRFAAWFRFSVTPRPRTGPALGPSLDECTATPLHFSLRTHPCLHLEADPRPVSLLLSALFAGFLRVGGAVIGFSGRLPGREEGLSCGGERLSGPGFS